MIARLWWKEARLFWPIWAFLVLIAAAGQWLALHYFGSDARNGALGAMAIGWTCLYAFAAAAAAFAGEREGRTLLFLDTHAVSRFRLWGSKVSFAVATTLALAAVLVGLAALGTDRWETGQERMITVAFACVAVLLEALGWGLFWSAVSASALTAAALAVCSMAFAQVAMMQGYWFSPDNLVSATWLRLGLAVAASGVSAVVLTWNGSGRPATGWSSRLPRRTGQRRSAWIRPSLTGGLTRRETVDPAQAASRRSVAMAAARSLIWVTVREAFPFWWRIVALNLGLILLSYLQVYRFDDRAWVLTVNPVIALLGGVYVFGTEPRARTHRFLAHHGVSPGWAWAVKTAVWAGALLTPVWAILGAFAVFMVTRHGFNDAQGVPLYAAVLINGFVIGQFCGMAIKRGITAALVATVVLIVAMVPLGGLHNMEMLPSWGLFAISPALLVVGWAWSRDWLLDRPGPGRLIRLSLLLATALGVLVIGYIAHRVASVPDLRPALVQSLAMTIPSPEASTTPNSVDLYREATRRFSPVPQHVQGLFERPGSSAGRGVETTGEPMTAEAGAWLRKNAEALALVRRATDLPRSPIDRQTLSSRPQGIYFRGLSLLLVVSHRERRERGDLDGAWEDLAALLRMARQLNGPVALGLAFDGLSIEQQALGLAMNWAVDSRQTSERLRASLAEYRKLQVPFSDASDSIRVEARVAEQTLNLPRAEVAERLVDIISSGRPDSWLAAWSRFITTRWEIERARRAFPLLFAAKVFEAGLEPWQRVLPQHLTDGWNNLRVGDDGAGEVISGADLSHIQRSTPLVKQLIPPVDALIEANDRNEVARRALVQILALRSWQVQHGGRLPDRLAELVPSELDSLPGDPYTNSAFRYIRSEGQRLLPLGQLDPLPTGHFDSELVPTAGHRLLYSVGLNRQDDHARENLSQSASSTDIIFPLPESVPQSRE